MKIQVDDLTGPEVATLLEQHVESMKEHTPPESKHALDLDALRKPDITFWTAWIEGDLAGCGAMKELDPHHGEIKSMKTAPAHVRKGVARGLLERIIQEAKDRGYQKISLETGAMEIFEPARRLYEGFGFRYCGPFSDYIEDPNTVFMTKEF